MLNLMSQDRYLHISYFILILIKSLANHFHDMARLYYFFLFSLKLVLERSQIKNMRDYYT